MVETAFGKIFQLLILVFVGYLLKKAGILTEEDAQKIITLNTFTFLPALIFYVIYTSRFEQQFLMVPIVGLFIMLFLTGISYFVGKLAGINEKRFLMPFVVASSAGNTGYVGYPVCLALFGKKGLVIAVAYDIFATVFYALIIAALLISYGAGKAENPLKLVKSVFTFPPTIAAIFALLMKGIQIPDFFTSALSFFSQAAIPLTLVALGISIKITGNFSYLKNATLSVILKLGISPLMAYLVAPWFLSGLAGKVTVIQAGMPALMLTYILSVRYETEPEYASFLVFFSTVLSLFTLPILTYLAG